MVDYNFGLIIILVDYNFGLIIILVDYDFASPGKFSLPKGVGVHNSRVVDANVADGFGVAGQERVGEVGRVDAAARASGRASLTTTTKKS